MKVRILLRRNSKLSIVFQTRCKNIVNVKLSVRLIVYRLCYEAILHSRWLNNLGLRDSYDTIIKTIYQTENIGGILEYRGFQRTNASNYFNQSDITSLKFKNKKFKLRNFAFTLIELQEHLAIWHLTRSTIQTISQSIDDTSFKFKNKKSRNSCRYFGISKIPKNKRFKVDFNQCFS